MRAKMCMLASLPCKKFNCLFNLPVDFSLLTIDFSYYWHLLLLTSSSTRWQSRRTCTHLLLRELQNYNSLLNNHPQENVGAHQKRIPHVQGQRISPSNMVGGAKSHLESKSLPARGTQRAQTKPCAHQETPQRRSQNCLWVSPVKLWVSSGLPQGQGLWVQQTWVCHKPSWRRLPFTPPQSTRTYTRLGKQTLGGHKQNLWAPGPKRKEQWPYKRLTQTWVWVSRVSGRGVCQWWHAAGSGALSAAVHARDLLKEVAIFFITSTIVWSQIKQQGGNTELPINKKIGLTIYWAWPHPSEQDPVSSSVSLSHQEASISLLSLSIRGQTEWKPQSQKTNQTGHMIHSLV